MSPHRVRKGNWHRSGNWVLLVLVIASKLNTKSSQSLYMLFYMLYIAVWASDQGSPNRFLTHWILWILLVAVSYGLKRLANLWTCENSVSGCVHKSCDDYNNTHVSVNRKWFNSQILIQYILVYVIIIITILASWRGVLPFRSTRWLSWSECPRSNTKMLWLLWSLWVQIPLQSIDWSIGGSGFCLTCPQIGHDYAQNCLPIVN